MSRDTRFRYLVAAVKADWKGSVDNEKLQRELDAQGNLGWELVSVVADGFSLRLVFKKPS